jgi:hypothetical protein
MQFSDLSRRSKLPKLDSSDILPLAFAGLSVGVFILAVSLFWLAFSFSKLTQKPAPTLVQQVDGRAFTVRSADQLYREPEVIRRVVSDWAVMTFTWGSLPGEENPVEEGVKVSGNHRVTHAAWEAGFLLATDFRDAFLQQLATAVIPPAVFEGQVSAVLIPQQVSPPQVVDEGLWQVDLIATRIVFDDTNPAGTTIPFNRRFYVRAIEPPRNPLIDNASEYQQVVYRLLESGLQIEEIRPIQPEEFRP